MSKYLFIDLETTGLSHSSRILELSFIYDENGQSTTYHSLVIPSYDIKSTQHIDYALVTNGISLDEAKEKGKTISQVISEILPFIEKTDHIIAHNAPFDKRFLLAEIRRLVDGDSIAKKIERKSFICTVREASKLGLREKNGNLRLGNLYNKLFGREIIGCHRALTDTKACREIFYKILELKNSLPSINTFSTYKQKVYLGESKEKKDDIKEVGGSTHRGKKEIIAESEEKKDDIKEVGGSTHDEKKQTTIDYKKSQL